MQVFLGGGCHPCLLTWTSLSVLLCCTADDDVANLILFPAASQPLLLPCALSAACPVRDIRVTLIPLTWLRTVFPGELNATALGHSFTPSASHLYPTHSTNMFAVAASSVTARAPVRVQAKATSAPAKAPVKLAPKMLKKAQAVVLTASTTMLPAFAAMAEEDVQPVDLKLAIGFTVFAGIAAFSTLPEPESSKHGGDH